MKTINDAFNEMSNDEKFASVEGLNRVMTPKRDETRMLLRELVKTYDNPMELTR